MIHSNHKYILSINIFYLFLLFFIACEKDDVCIRNLVTPRMNMVFFSDSTSEQTPVDELKLTRIPIWEEGRVINNDTTNVDSIFVPLPPSVDQVSLIFEYSNNNKDTIELNYQRDDVYVNKACGFKTVFSNLSVIEYSTNKIVRIKVNEQTIESENASHLLVYF